jgi:hypothetical protein
MFAPQASIDILVERGRQIDQEGWTTEHDDAHSDGEMLRAADIYLRWGTDRAPCTHVVSEWDSDFGKPVSFTVPHGWPWSGRWWNPKDRRRNLVRAGALCVADKERLTRAGRGCGFVDHQLVLVQREIEIIDESVRTSALRFDFVEVVRRLDASGWAAGDVEWSESVKEPDDAVAFARETIYVICNSGMRFTVARKIFDKVVTALDDGQSSSAVFGHKGKTGAIDRVWKDRDAMLAEYLASADKLAYLAGIPWIGGITKYHLGKNFGLQMVKPDVHLQRLADIHGMTPTELCQAALAQSGLSYKIATADTLIWRACATGVLDSRTGLLVRE